MTPTPTPRRTPQASRLALPVGLDDSTSWDLHGYSLTRVVRNGPYRVRVQVYRDSYVFQSYAVAEVLADNMTWTPLASEDPMTWFDSTARPSGPVHVDTELGDIAENLVHRAAHILLR
ncbi:hypothetical protein ACFQ68_08625 [Amycolatopsis japonica]|uniref:hypothetical protein n=1 Tax=Amycolatopsis japonica TaxID=208439 RepID=UPI00366A5AAA